MDTLLQDLRYAVRSLLKSPGFAIVAVLTLALGIGANTAIFSVVNAVLLRPLPYAEPGRLMMVWERNAQKGRDRNVISPGNFLDWQSQNRVFSDLAALSERRANLGGVGEPEELPVEVVTGNFFRTIGVQPALGRTFTEAEDRPGGERAVLVSYDSWQRLFGGSADVLDRSVVLNETPYRIVGVMPAGFTSPGAAALGLSGRDRPQAWVPMRLDPSRDYRNTTGRYLLAVGRLKPGTSEAEAQGDFDVIARRLSDAYPGFDAGWDVHLIPLGEQLVGGVRRALWILAGVVGFVLLIACANVANLQLVRAAARQREIAVRAALGASRGRVVRQLLAESVLLGVVGGLVGLLFAAWGTGLLSALGSAGLPRASEIRADGWTLLVTLGLSLASGILFGVTPALHASRPDLHEALRESARATGRGSRTRALLVGAQVALSMMLLVGAGLLIRSFDRLRAEDPGFNPEHVLTARVQLASARYDSTERQVRFFQDLLERVRHVPGVRAASAITWLPFSGLGSATRIYVEGRPLPRPGEEFSADIRAVDPQYFRTMQIPLRRGTPFTDADDARARKAIVINATMARTMFPGQDPIGQHILMPWDDTLRGEIVAIVGDAKHVSLDSLARPMIYWAMSQFPSPFMTLVVRAAGEPMGIVPAVRAELRALDADQPLADVRPLAEYLGRSVAQRRFTTLLVAAFAAIALALAAVGLYGVLAYSVSQRTREIGVRMALGARAADVLRMVVRQGMIVVGAGVVVGIGGALALTRVMNALLYGVTATDPPTFIGVIAVFGFVALLACWLPARRATRVDPMVALRSE